MLQSLSVIELILSIIIIVSVLLQNKGTGLSATFGGDFSGFHTKRGLEKFLTVLSAVSGALFIINALIIFILTATK